MLSQFDLLIAALARQHKLVLLTRPRFSSGESYWNRELALVCNEFCKSGFFLTDADPERGSSSFLSLPSCVLNIVRLVYCLCLLGE
jgi:hypothetical protein